MSHPSSSRHALAIGGAAVFLALGGTAAYVWWLLIGPGRLLEAERLQEQLSAIPAVTEVEVHGHEDVGYEIDGFTLEVDGHGALEIGELSDDPSGSLEKLHIYSIGHHRVTYAVEGFLGAYNMKSGEPTRSHGWGTGFTVGTSGAHSHLFPFPLHSVVDVVEHYDEICEILTAWPVQPDYAKLVDLEGAQWFYALTDPAKGSEWLQPTELARPR